eukprot:241128-Ditylum_brightwellii.AAC.1
MLAMTTLVSTLHTPIVDSSEATSLPHHHYHALLMINYLPDNRNDRTMNEGNWHLSYKLCCYCTMMKSPAKDH